MKLAEKTPGLEGKDVSMKLAARMSRLGTETAFEVLAKARALEEKGKSIIHLQIGEPDFDTPKHIREAAKKALDDGMTHYTPSAGYAPLRDAVVRWIKKTRGLDIKRENVVITTGGKPVMFHGILALVDEGDEVVCPNPGYPIYESMINFAGGKPVPLPILEEKDFRFDVRDLEKLVGSKTKLIIINSPQNPTGGVLNRDDLKAIARLAKKYDCWILADEIYSQILYDGTKFESIATEPDIMDRLIILDGWSKSYAMTGWRMGYGIMPEKLAVHVTRLITNSESCNNTFAQIGGMAALDGPQDGVGQMVAEFKRRRDAMVDGLNRIKGFSCKKPLGAFYAFPNIKKTGKTSKELADYLLYEAGVACLAGTCFGSYGEGYLRFSYANSIENIREALKKIESSVCW